MRSLMLGTELASYPTQYVGPKTGKQESLGKGTPQPLLVV